VADAIVVQLQKSVDLIAPGRRVAFLQHRVAKYSPKLFEVFSAPLQLLGCRVRIQRS